MPVALQTDHAGQKSEGEERDPRTHPLHDEQWGEKQQEDRQARELDVELPERADQDEVRQQHVAEDQASQRGATVGGERRHQRVADD